MAKKRKKVPAKQGKKAGYRNPPKEHRFKAGQSGNPKGRPPAGASVIEWHNQLADATEAQLRKIARDKKQPWSKRTAAERMIRTLEAPDLADFDDYLEQGRTLKQLRDSGVNTEAVKKAKVKTRTTEDGAVEVEREIELYDRAGDEYDRVLDRSNGRAKQAIDHTTNGKEITLLPIKLDGDKEL